MERRSGIDFYFNKSNEAMCCAYVLRMFVWEDRWLFLVFNDSFRNSVLISIIVLFIKFVYENKTNSEFPNFCSSDQENPGSENLWCCGTQNIYIHQRKDSNAATQWQWRKWVALRNQGGHCVNPEFAVYFKILIFPKHVFDFLSHLSKQKSTLKLFRKDYPEY